MVTDPGFATALAHALEASANQALHFDPGSKAALAQLNGTVLALNINQPSMSLFFLPLDDGQLQLFAHWDGEVTTSLSGNLINVLGLLRSNTHSLADSGVTVSGKVSLLGDYQKIMSQLDIDWEDGIAGVIGDMPAHFIAGIFHGANNWLQPRVKRWPAFWGEIITDELQLIPAKPEIDAFSNDVDELRAAVDRLEARINNLHPSPENKT